MVAPAIAPDPPQRLHLPPAMERLGRAMCLSLTATMFLVAAWLCVRRLAGEMLQPLGFLALLSVGAILAGIVSAVRTVGIGAASSATSQPQRMAMLRVLPGFATMLIGLVLTLPGTSLAAAAALWCCIGLNEGFWIWLWMRRHNRGPHAPIDSSRPRAETAAAPTTSPLVEEVLPERVADPLDEGELQLPQEVSQQITRTQSGTQGDTLAGLLRAVFLPGERSRYLHVAICPPMSGRPNVEVVQLSGPSTRVKAAEVQSFGVRFDLRLVSASSHEETVLIHFEACCPD